MEFGVYNRFRYGYRISEFFIVFGYQKVDPMDDGVGFHEITLFNIGFRFRLSTDAKEGDKFYRESN